MIEEIKIKLKHKNYSLELNINSKITLLIGNSSTGKTVKTFKAFSDAHFDADGYKDYKFEDIHWPLKIDTEILDHQ